MRVSSASPPQGPAGLARLWDKLALRLSRHRRIDGLWVGCFFTDGHQRALDRVEEALRLIKVHDPLRYDRILRDLDRILLTLVPDGIAQFKGALKLCELDERYVLAGETTPEQIASVIVHEATHARLMHCGIGYEADLRARVEAVCFRRQRAFADKLPSGELARADAERLAGYPRDYWTDKASDDRFEQGSADALRYLGAPDFVFRAVMRIRPLVWRGIRVVRRLTGRLRR